MLSQHRSIVDAEVGARRCEIIDLEERHHEVAKKHLSPHQLLLKHAVAQITGKRPSARVRYKPPEVGHAPVIKEEYQQEMMLSLEITEAKPVDGVTRLNGGFADSAFADNKQRPIHRWVPWIAGFSSEFVRDTFKRYLPTTRTLVPVVLDPFSGVGTTLVEALRCGYDAIGFEINPYAALASRAKCEAAQISPAQLQRYIIKFENFMKEPNGETAQPPPHFRSRIPFFGERAEVKALKALRFIRRLSFVPLQDLFSLAFGAVMVNLSNYSYEPSLSSRPAVGKAIQNDAPVAESIAAKLLAMKSDVQSFRAEMEKLPRQPSGRVIEDNFLNAMNHINPASVDLIVTSPPYLNNYHYIRNTRPQLFWLGFVCRPGELKRLEIENFGKYWQTVRDLKHVPLEFQHSRLEHLLDQVRSVNPDRGIYGGNGWANYAASYFNDMSRFCRVVSQVLKPRGYGVVVIGNSILQGVEIPVDNILAELAKGHGLIAESIHVIRQKRVGASIVSSSVRQGAKTTARLYESAVVLRKA
jgi:SAM-dependent methyltransferase